MGLAAPFSAASARTSAFWSERVEGRFPFAVESVVAIPLEGDAASLGALGIFTKRGAPAFGDQDVALLSLVTANVSTALRLFRASAARERGERLTSIGRLLSQVIHDFKTPMTVISGYVQLLVAASDPKERTDYAKRILKQFDVLTAMQREVLEFARGDTNVFIRRVYLHKFMGDIRQQLGHELEGRAIELEMSVDTKAVVRFDEGRMARAIHNLARNAIEAMAERGGKLGIDARLVENDLVVAVSDTGPGIPKEIEGRLFQSFVTAGKKDGTGLGLAIVKKIVEEHGGTVTVRSSPEGSTFELRIPQANARTSLPAPPKAPPAPSKKKDRPKKRRGGRAPAAKSQE
jgi:signal transduction histidine kinase